MRLGKWQFNPTLWPTLVTVVLLGVLVLLGIWQLHRADYKRALLAQYQRASTSLPVSVNQAANVGGLDTLGRYRHAQARGHYDSARQVLLDNMQQGNQVGYQVLTPLVLQPGGQILLVNRGFVARDPGIKALPDVDVSSNERSISGILGILPVPGIRLGKTTIPAGWPKLMLYPGYQTLTELYGSRLLKPVLLLDADQVDGFIRAWQPDVGFPPVRHDAYALQWFALAMALLVIWIIVNSSWAKHD
jgi:surfeit locus 1 family protein